MVKEENFTFFFGQYCPLSNFYPAKFTLDGNTFNCTEQFIQFSKAQLFGDQKTAADILLETDPVKQKSLGRKVINFDLKKWQDAIPNLITRGIAQKIEENVAVKNFLQDTGDTEIVEASIRDRIFGIGLSLTDKNKTDKTKWNGMNLQGKMLQEIRENLM